MTKVAGAGVHRGRPVTTLGAAIAALAIALPAFLPGEAGAAAQLRRGLIDSLFHSGDDATRSLWLDRASDAGSGLVTLPVNWPLIAPSPPSAGSDPGSPADPRYRFAALDALVRSVLASGQRVILFIGGTPEWAEGQGRPPESVAAQGTWKPNPIAFGDFVHAVAARYSGGFRDASGALLPRVRYFKLWNEPNLPGALMPQWNGTRPASPAIYRRLLNQGYPAVKSVHKTNRVIAPSLAPYGDPPGQKRMRPLVFLRRLLCLNAKLKKTRCAGRTRFDILSHQPINQFAPTRHAGRNDATTPDLRRITRVVRAASRVGTLRPRGPKPLWVTEFWWASNPPSSFGVPPHRQARWLAQAMYLFWKQGARAAMWFQIRDPQPTEATVGTGLYFQNGNPKPSLTAFRFPFVVDGAELPKGKARLWGISPDAGRVRVQIRRAAGWRTVRRFRGSGVFTGIAKVPTGSHLRAVSAGGDTSRSWRFGRR